MVFFSYNINNNLYHFHNFNNLNHHHNNNHHHRIAKDQKMRVKSRGYTTLVFINHLEY